VIAKISHMTLLVRDQKKAYDVYVGKLGFKVNTDATMENGMRWLTVTPPGQPDIEIVLAEPRSPMIRDDLVGHYKAILKAEAMGAGVWECDDCLKTYQELKGKGIEALSKDGCGNWFSLTEHEKK
jgi:catechol 2,3-dioxygenase-like lactoylglutathione lyase family enzyme